MSDKELQTIKRTKSGAIDLVYYEAYARELRSQAFARAARLMGNALLRFIHVTVVGPMRRQGMDPVDRDKIIQEANVRL